MTAQLTNKQKKAEFIRSGRNPLYFINDYCKVPHAIKGILPFRTYQFQDELVKNFRNNRFNIVLKARQLGITTIVSGYILWLMVFYQNKEIVILATKKETAAIIVEKVRQMYEYLPLWMKEFSPIDKKTDNKWAFRLQTGSRIRAEATSSDAGRGRSPSLLVIDEAAHVENLDGDNGIWTSIFPSLSTGGSCIAISTPNGVGNWFHGIYVGAEHRQNEFVPTKLMWDVHPDRDEDWFETETSNMKPREIAQELLCNFNSSGDTVLSPGDLNLFEDFLKEINPLTNKTYDEPLYRTGVDRNYWIWNPPREGHSYLMTCDVARGDGKDFSTFHILDLKTNEVVAEYQGKITYDVFSDMILRAAKEYNYPLLVVENNKGDAILMKLEESGYPRLYYSKKGSHDFVNIMEGDSREDIVAGFTTSMKTRPAIIAKMEECFRNGIFKVYSKRLYDELRTFIWNNGRPEAQRGCNDDLVMSFAMMCWIKETALEENTRDIEYSKAMLAVMTKKTRVLDTTIQGNRNIHFGPHLTRQSNKQRSIEERQKYSWLFKDIPIFKG